MSKMKISESKLKRLIETIVEQEQEKYQEIFRAVMDEFGIDSPEDLEGNSDKEKAFYNTVDTAYAMLEDGDSIENIKQWIKDTDTEDVDMKEVKELRKVIRKMVEAVLDGDDTRAGAKRFGPMHKRSKAQKRGAGFEPEDEDEMMEEVYKRVVKRLAKARK